MTSLPSSYASPTIQVSFRQPNLLSVLRELDDQALDTLDFGVIGFDAEGRIRRYNRFESESAGLTAGRVIGQSMFFTVAPCMNNFMVAQQFEDQQAENSTLDITLDYVLTLRMRPVKVELRLLAAPDSPLRYVLVFRGPR